MVQIDDAMPSHGALRAALRETTQRLAREFSVPGLQAPAWSDVEWRVAMAACAIHGISGLLHGRLRWQGPPVWQSFLAEQKQQTLLRQQRISALLAQLNEAGHAAGIPMVAMKGSALLALGVFADGERPMSDIDLLVRPQDRDRMLQLLQAMGYVVELAISRHVCLRPAASPSSVAFGEHAHNPVKIELHERVYEPLPIREVDITTLVFAADARSGINAYPSKAALMRHLLLHTAGNIRAGSLRFIQLHDIACLARRLDTQDWAVLIRDEADARGLWWALPPLRLASSHFADAIPESVIRQVERSSRLLLRWSLRRRTLVDVSLSAPSIPALPGLSWSASPAEAMTMMARRLMPGDDVHAIRRSQASNHFRLASPTWSRASQAAKIVRWFLHRPPAAMTMYSVQQALAWRPVDAAWSASNKAAV